VQWEGGRNDPNVVCTYEYNQRRRKNMPSESFLTVLVIYLGLHQGAGMQTQQVVFFIEM
jgi:hypothetical protein